MLQKLFRHKLKMSAIATCICCGKPITGSLPAMAYPAPYYWQQEYEGKPGNYLGTDFCVIQDESFYIRTVLTIPLTDKDEHFQWGIWVSLSKKNFQRYKQVYGTEKELHEEPYFGWFANQIPIYPDCLKIKTNVILRGGQNRPELILDHSNQHPLCQEQHNGIPYERAQAIVAELVSGATAKS